MSFLPYPLILLRILHQMKEEVDMLLVALHRYPLINAMIPSEVARQEHRRVEPVHVVGQVVVMYAICPAPLETCQREMMICEVHDHGAVG